jgi:hypothetical protein
VFPLRLCSCVAPRVSRRDAALYTLQHHYTGRQSGDRLTVHATLVNGMVIVLAYCPLPLSLPGFSRCRDKAPKEVVQSMGYHTSLPSLDLLRVFGF